MEAQMYTTSKSIERQKPYVVMKRADSIFAVQLTSATAVEVLGWSKHRFSI